MVVTSLVAFVGFLGLLRFIWWVYKIAYAYLRPAVDLKKKGVEWVLVTGASSGIGKAIALKVADQGINVIGVGRNKQALEELEAAITAKGVEFRPVVKDLSQPTAAGELFESLEPKLQIGAVFVAHGGRTPKPFVDFTNQELIDYNNLMMTTNVLLAKHYAERTSERGNITYISSLHNFTYLPYNQNYGSVKRFLNQFVHMYQFEVRDMWIQVLNPGRVRGTKFFDTVPPELKNYFNSPWCASWSLTPERVANFALSTIGTNFDVDIGFEAIIARVIFWIVPPPVIDFILRKTAPKIKAKTE
jgi:short-subunit dehydrogenase